MVAVQVCAKQHVSISQHLPVDGKLGLSAVGVSSLGETKRPAAFLLSWSLVCLHWWFVRGNVCVCKSFTTFCAVISWSCCFFLLACHLGTTALCKTTELYTNKMISAFPNSESKDRGKYIWVLRTVKLWVINKVSTLEGTSFLGNSLVFSLFSIMLMSETHTLGSFMKQEQLLLSLTESHFTA